jgi:hypothetical protein
MGLEPVDGQWSTFLKENRSLTSDVNLVTKFQEIAEDFDMYFNLAFDQRKIAATKQIWEVSGRNG